MRKAVLRVPVDVVTGHDHVVAFGPDLVAVVLNILKRKPERLRTVAFAHIKPGPEIAGRGVDDIEFRARNLLDVLLNLFGRDLYAGFRVLIQNDLGGGLSIHNDLSRECRDRAEVDDDCGNQ